MGGTGTDFEATRTAYAAVVLPANESLHDGILSKCARAACRVLKAQILAPPSMKSLAGLVRISATMSKDSSNMHTRDLGYPAASLRLFITLTLIGGEHHSQSSRFPSTRSNPANTEKALSHQQAVMMTGRILVCPWKAWIALRLTLPLASATSRA